jgi:hypothetical protein
MTVSVRMGTQYGSELGDRQANGDGRKLDGIGEKNRASSFYFSGSA